MKVPHHHFSTLAASLALLAISTTFAAAQDPHHSGGRVEHPSTPRAVVASVYNWYCAQEVASTPAGIEPIQGLLSSDLYADLSRADSVATNPFTRGAKACSFRLGYSFVSDDVAVVNVSLFTEGRRLNVVTQLNYSPDGWVISQVRHWKAGRMVRRPTPTPAPPPN